VVSYRALGYEIRGHSAPSMVPMGGGELAARQSSASSGTRKFGLLGGQIQRGEWRSDSIELRTSDLYTTGKIGVDGERSVIFSACRIKVKIKNVVGCGIYPLQWE
jgi:hypothetical protein